MRKKVPVYGIKNCDTVRKALKWLTEHQIDYDFHDLKKEIPHTDAIKAWLKDVDKNVLINRRGLTWRKLDEAEKTLLDSQVEQLIQTHPTLLKRPLIFVANQWHVGFKPDEWTALFHQSINQA